MIKSTESLKKYIVITTINPKSENVKKLEGMQDWNIVVIGDKKSQKITSTPNLTFLSIKDQEKLGFNFVKVCPYNHYSRKNIGYLYAIQNGADVIYETDDDNIPNENWRADNFECSNGAKSADKFVNIYSYFSDSFIWPRGFPLDEIQSNQFRTERVGPTKIGVWQGLCNDEPDVDAIYRLLFNKKIKFDEKENVFLPAGVYCPFNSQNTFWQKKSFQGLYLPTTVSFRFTDTLRGYIAQKLMWQKDLHLGFTKPTAYQKRNAHNLMKDFEDEIDCYKGIKQIVEVIDGLELQEDTLTNLKVIYEELIKEGFVRKEELKPCLAWAEDYKGIQNERE